MTKLKTLRSSKSFDKFIVQERCVVISYNYLCPACERYLDELKEIQENFFYVPVGRIHQVLNWVIKEAGMIGEVEEENIFLMERYGVGNSFPDTLFFSNGNLISSIKGYMAPDDLQEQIKQVFFAEEIADQLKENEECPDGVCSNQ